MLKKIAYTLDVDADMLYDDYYRFLALPYPEKIKELREKHHLTQKELGNLFNISRCVVGAWESGRHRVTRDVWEKLRELGLI